MQRLAMVSAPVAANSPFYAEEALRPLHNTPPRAGKLATGTMI